MLLHLRLKRPGGSINSFGGIDYLFAPAPADPTGPHVCEVADPAAIQRFLSIDGFSIFGADVQAGSADAIEIDAGEVLTFGVTKTGVLSVTALGAMGLTLLDQALAISGDTKAAVSDAGAAALLGPAKGMNKPAVKVVAAQTPPATPPAATVTTAPATVVETPPDPEKPPADGTATQSPVSDGLDALGDDDLAALIKTTLGRGPKAGTPREAQINSLRARGVKAPV